MQVSITWKGMYDKLNVVGGIFYETALVHWCNEIDLRSMGHFLMICQMFTFNASNGEAIPILQTGAP